MARDPRLYLVDIGQAAKLVEEFVHGKTLDEFRTDAMLRSAVERQFEIIGEAINQLSRVAPELAARIPDARRIVDFRNVLAHGYATVDGRVVWHATQTSLPQLQATVADMLRPAAVDIKALMNEGRD
ncbi:MAG: DUF86 domain-containing protein [Azonexus sp.]|jgi:uncharacterized protein with HEPN domain|nr:DUF86 domain-containing protein [Betaproteobacteria bacterium]MBK8917597.1 DUF86 domain-containing protein [Betaproteobacteria bacterium]MBP6037367.1 DUF86 domain-containing protein [Azonexus sp.]MBP6907996.1 DUF86 domain-containing protein [Azonexus sp.]